MCQNAYLWQLRSVSFIMKTYSQAICDRSATINICVLMAWGKIGASSIKSRVLTIEVATAAKHCVELLNKIWAKLVTKYHVQIWKHNIMHVVYMNAVYNLSYFERYALISDKRYTQKYNPKAQHRLHDWPLLISGAKAYKIDKQNLRLIHYHYRRWGVSQNFVTNRCVFNCQVVIFRVTCTLW